MNTKTVDNKNGIYIITEQHYAYHLTLKENMEGIIRKGLIPQCGPNCKRVDDTSVGIHFATELADIYDFWIMALYEKMNKEELEILRFNIQNRRYQHLYYRDHYIPGDWIILDRILSKDIEYLNNIDENMMYDKEKQIWLPIEQYKSQNIIKKIR